MTEKNKVLTKKRLYLLAFGLFIALLFPELGLRLGGFIFLKIQKWDNDEALKNENAFKILCLGESMTALGGKNSYPKQLEHILNKSSLKRKVITINKGLPGTNSMEILANLEKNIEKYKPEMIITMIGINDAAIFPITNKEVFAVINALQKKTSVPNKPFIQRCRMFELFYRMYKFIKAGAISKKRVKIYKLVLNKNSPTWYCYRMIKKIIINKNIPFVCVQYPTQNVMQLKSIFASQKGMIFVDNEQIFKKAIENESFEKYFYDYFAYDFGHCTKKGNHLLAKNIADKLMKKFFSIRNKSN